jgi:nucleotide-binding universal stress UspA family protein
MYGRILVPLKGDTADEPVIAHTSALARMSGGAVTLLRVVHSHSREQAAYFDQQARAYLDSQVAKLKAEGVTAEGRVVIGEPAPVIVEVARDLPADLVIMATHGHSGVRHVIMGSVTEEVVRNGSAPVLLVRPAGD